MVDQNEYNYSHEELMNLLLADIERSDD